MAFGFTRAPGASRGYVNQDNPLFAPGQRLSRRQYDKYIEQIGARTHLPGAQAMRDAERRLEALREALAEQSAALDEREREVTERELAIAEREKEAIGAGVHRRARQGAGQRRYNLVLDLYTRAQREGGRTLTKRQAAREPAFRTALADIKGKPNPRNNANTRAKNLEGRRRGFAAIGGQDEFKEQYEARYGRVNGRSRNPRHSGTASSTRGGNSRNRQRGR